MCSFQWSRVSNHVIFNNGQICLCSVWFDSSVRYNASQTGRPVMKQAFCANISLTKQASQTLQSWSVYSCTSFVDDNNKFSFKWMNRWDELVPIHLLTNFLHSVSFENLWCVLTFWTREAEKPAQKFLSYTRYIGA